MEFINAGITFDGSGVQAGMKDAADAIKKGGEEIGKAANDAATKSDFAFKSLTQAYRQTAKDAQFLAETQGINSKAFIDAATKAGQYKNALDDVNIVVNAMSADKPVLQATLNLAQSLSGGFAAAQGAMAMFGGKSKEVDEALKKVQGSLALLQGLTALSGLQDAWKGFTITLNTKVIPALTTTKGLMMSMGIGALVIAIGYLVNAWMDASAAQEKAIENQKHLKEEIAKSKNIIEEYVLSEKELAIKAENDKYKAVIEAHKKTLQGVKTHYDQLGRVVIDYEAEAKTDRKKEYAEWEKIEKAHKQNLADIDKKFAPKEKKTTKAKFEALPIAFDEILPKKGINLEVGLKMESAIKNSGLQGASQWFINTTENMKQSMTSFRESTLQVFDEISAKFEDFAKEGFAKFGEAIGQQLMGAKGAVDQAAWGIVASFASIVGQTFIAVGTAAAAAGAWTKAAAMIGAGVAIMAIAGAAGAAAGSAPGGSGGGGGGGYSGASSNGTFQPQTSFFSATGILYGNDMLLAIQKSNQKMQRVK